MGYGVEGEMVEVRVEGLNKRFGSLRVLKGVSFTAPNSEITALLGPSGCGKTTILRIIAGLEDPDEGEVFFDGVSVTKLPPKERNVGFVFQDLALFPHLTVLRNVTFGLEVRGKSFSEAKKIAREYLRMLKLEGLEDRYPYQLSGGQRQRVAIARALAPEPNVLLLDEPFGSLDYQLREELLWEMKELFNERGVTAIHVTHDHHEALTLADRLILIMDGKVMRAGSVEEVISDPKYEEVASFLGANVLSLPKVGVPEDLRGLKVAFYPENVKLTEDGIEASVRVLSRDKTGYRVKAQALGQTIELFLRRKPPERFRFIPTEFYVIK